VNRLGRLGMGEGADALLLVRQRERKKQERKE
jgi:hypothetical protein